MEAVNQGASTCGTVFRGLQHHPGIGIPCVLDGRTPGCDDARFRRAEVFEQHRAEASLDRPCQLRPAAARWPRRRRRVPATSTPDSSKARRCTGVLTRMRGPGTSAKRRRDVRRIQRAPTVDTHAAEQRHQDRKLHAVHVLWRHGRHDPWQRSPCPSAASLSRSLDAFSAVQAVNACPRLRVWPAAGRCCRTCSRSRPPGRAGSAGIDRLRQRLGRPRLLDACIVQHVAARMLFHHLIDHRGNPRRRQQADLSPHEHGREGDEEVVAPLAEVQRRGPVGERRRQRAAQAPGIGRRSWPRPEIGEMPDLERNPGASLSASGGRRATCSRRRTRSCCS